MSGCLFLKEEEEEEDGKTDGRAKANVPGQRPRNLEIIRAIKIFHFLRNQNRKQCSRCLTHRSDENDKKKI